MAVSGREPIRVYWEKETITMRHILIFFLLSVSAPVLAQEAPAVEAPAVEAPAVEAPAVEASAEVEAPADKAEAPADKAEAPADKADEAPSEEQIEATADSVSLLVDALQSKNWALAIGILLSLLVAFANRFGLKDKVGGKAIPWVTAGVAVLGAVGAALMAGISIMEAASQGLVAGVAAIGGWEMILKHILAPKSDPAAAEE